MISSRSSMGTYQKETSPFQMLNHELRNIGTANKSGLSHALACCDTSRRDFPWGFGTSALFILCAPQDPVCKPTGCSPRVQMSCVLNGIHACLPFATKTLPTRKMFFSNYFPITVSRFRFLRINFRKLPGTYCICVSCVTLPGWDPCPCRIIFYYRYPI